MTIKLIEEIMPNAHMLYSDLEQHFPKSELKDVDIFTQIINEPEYKIFNIYSEENKICGGFCFLEFPDNTFIIDYIRIAKDCQSMGFGSKTFYKIKETFKYDGCYLEVEKENPNDKNTTRRIKFYKNLGAELLDINYFYPNNYGNLPMDLYYMPLANPEIPTREKILTNIKILFDKIHFDIEHSNELYKTICNK